MTCGLVDKEMAGPAKRLEIGHRAVSVDRSATTPIAEAVMHNESIGGTASRAAVPVSFEYRPPMAVESAADADFPRSFPHGFVFAVAGAARRKNLVMVESVPTSFRLAFPLQRAFRAPATLRRWGSAFAYLARRRRACEAAAARPSARAARRLASRERYTANLTDVSAFTALPTGTALFHVIDPTIKGGRMRDFCGPKTWKALNKAAGR